MLSLLRLCSNRHPDQLGWAELVSACTRDMDDSALWREFLCRYGSKIKQFIRGTWRLSIRETNRFMDARLGGVQENDLFQSTIVRLVEQDCAAMKRFSGKTEDAWLAYLAVITRSVVRDWTRQQRRLKRPGGAKVVAMPLRRARRLALRQEGTEHLAIERALLAHEIRDLCRQTIHSFDAEFSSRNMLIFRLYFDHDLSANQIAQCRGVNLSKAGVEKVINRLKERIRSVVAVDAPGAMIQ